MPNETRHYEIWNYNGLDVHYTPELNGAGTDLAMPFVNYVKENVERDKPISKIFEWCAGPGFIGFALLADNLREKLCLADINPDAIACVQKTISENKLQDRVSVYLSDNFDSIPDSERFDLVVANPPNYCNLNPEHPWGFIYHNDLRPNDRGWVIHNAFYSTVVHHLQANAQLLIAEVEPFEKEVFLPASIKTPYDIRDQIPIEDFKEMMRQGGLNYVNSSPLLSYEDGAMYWMVVSEYLQAVDSRY